MSLRTTVLSGFNDRLHLWRSDRTHVLYRWAGMWGRWEMFFEGRWEPCYNDSGVKPFDLHGTHGETFIRVGEVR
ncbi:hypothetical protein JRC04_04615 [Mycolicibacterium sp. S2-37]|uniref:hypothetical protein n=1 Tax=Mycolicibacterium sp. S2-37 TaxID=2810297 RepID=UPI001A943D19|nr:hypothetical protein [Mycolicibacterium sp. S2-37]MBO0676741.1 hypothetical protein [Mycolicibacterium sp. S2-37]